MYTETLENKRRTGFISLLMVIGFVFGVIVLVTAFGAWGAVIGSAVPTYAAYAIAAVLAYLLIKRMLTDYRYTLAKDVIVFERVVGTRARILEQVELTDVTGFAPLDAAAQGGSVLRATFLRDDEAWALDYARKGKALRVVFHPTQKLIDKLNARMREPTEPRQQADEQEG